MYYLYEFSNENTLDHKFLLLRLASILESLSNRAFIFGHHNSFADFSDNIRIKQMVNPDNLTTGSFTLFEKVKDYFPTNNYVVSYVGYPRDSDGDTIIMLKLSNGWVYNSHEGWYNENDDVTKLAAIISEVDGKHLLCARNLAEKILEHPSIGTINKLAQ